MMTSMTSDFQRRGRAEPTETCILHAGTFAENGYGLVLVDGRNHYAHRLAWAEANGPIPAGAFICHTCDVRACINPEHLFNGNHRVNMMDMRAKGRGRAPFMSDDGKSWKLWAEKLEELGDGAFSGVDNLE